MTVPNCVDRTPVLPTASSEVAREFTRYFACSAAALATDFGLYALAMRLGFGWSTAAAVGFIAGLWIAYTLSVRFVFRDRSVSDARLEFALFAAIGFIGLLLTEVLLWLLVDRAGLSPMLAKVPTAGFVFMFNFAARKFLLFTRQRKAVFA